MKTTRNQPVTKLGLLIGGGLGLVLGFALGVERGAPPRAFEDPRGEVAEVGGAGSGVVDSNPVTARSAVSVPSQGPADVSLQQVQWDDAVHGSVVDAVSGQPVSKFRLFVCREGETELLAHAEGAPSEGLLRHDPYGRFHLPDLPPGTYSVLVDPDASGYERTVIHDVHVPGTAALVARVGRGNHVEGRVLDAAGRPVGELEVVLVDELEQDPRAGRTTRR